VLDTGEGNDWDGGVAVRAVRRAKGRAQRVPAADGGAAPFRGGREFGEQYWGENMEMKWQPLGRRIHEVIMVLLFWGGELAVIKCCQISNV
jgi:hypothetical protein